jgi:hypothetical protein
MFKPIQHGVAVVSLLSLGAFSSAYAQTAINFMANPAFTYSSALPAGSSSAFAPDGYSGELINIGGSCPLTFEQLKFDYKPTAFVNGQATELEVSVTNTSSQCSAGFKLFMPVVREPLPLNESAYLVTPPGGTLKFSAKFAVLSGGGSLGAASLGFTTKNAAGASMPEQALAIHSQELIAPGFVGYTYKVFTNESGTNFGYRPYFFCQSIAPGTTLKLSFKSPTLNYTAPVQDKATIAGLPQRDLRGAPGQKIKLSVPVLPPASNTKGGFTSQITLVDPFGQEQLLTQRVAAYMGTNSLSPVTDTWLIDLPTTLAEGRYTVRYRLNGPLVAGENATDVAGGTAADIAVLMAERSGGMYIGQHFHRMPNNAAVPRDSKCAANVEPPSGPNVYKSTYQFTRSLNNELANNMQLWWPVLGPVQDKDLATYVDPWADFHAGTTAAGDASKRLLLDFAGIPSWNSACTTNCDLGNRWGAWGLYGPKDLGTHLSGVYKLIQRYKGRIFAVECGNEPDSGYRANPSLLASPRDQMADYCKGVYFATKAVDPSIPVICPQPAHTTNLKYWLQAKTSANEPITQFCDVVGTHGYGFAGTDANGQPYLKSTGRDVLHEGGDLRDQVAHFRKVLADLGVNKPLMVTEAGFADGKYPDDPNLDWTSKVAFSDRSPSDRAELIYQTLASARELGLSGYTLYSFDGCGEVPAAGQPMSDVPYGFLGMTQSAAARETTASKLALAVKDLGVADAVNVSAKGRTEQRPYVSVQLDKAKLSLATGTAVNFVVNVSNTTLLPLAKVGVTVATSSSLMSLGAVSGAVCSTFIGTSCKVDIGTLQPGETRQVLVPATLKPSATQQMQLKQGKIQSLSAALSVTSQAAVPTAPASYDPTSLKAPVLGSPSQVTTPAKASTVVLTN